MSELSFEDKLSHEVAIKVMGWARDDFGDWSYVGKMRWQRFAAFILEKFDPGKHPYPPPYATDLGAAWELLEKFKDSGDYKIVISAYPKSQWVIKAYHRDGYEKSCTTSEESLPHAICLASLKATQK